MFTSICITALILFCILVIRKWYKDYHGKIKDIGRDDWMMED